MSALKEYFNLSRQERRGIFVLLSIIFAVILYNRLIPVMINTPKFDYQEFGQEINTFLAAQKVYNDSVKAFKSSYRTIPNPVSSSQKKPSKNIRIIEINAADTSALISLPGIGPYYAKRIIKYRDILGGYYRKEQLLEVYGMDSSRYLQYYQFISIDTNMIQKIDLNNVEFKTLLRHPYFDYEMVKAIFDYRRKHSRIKSNSELLKHHLMNNEEFRKTKPYLTIETIHASD